ncbi:hypothetical protein QTP86_009455 [Hemibagrus guttatus]|nr:hypothetical protein QTP86_009455 [Hemibagrus guttatus]
MAVSGPRPIRYEIQNLQKLHKSLTVIMSLLYIYILWVTACVDCNVSPTDAAESLVTVSAPVGSTVILPCNLTEVFNKTPVILWKIKKNYLVFERSSNGTSSGSGYEGRVDIPVDELLKGNCSLVLKNVRITDDHLYRTFRMEHVDSTNPTEVKEINRVSLSVYDQISARVGSTAVLPCEWSHLSIQTPHVLWVINSETVFERKGKELNQSKGYEGRVDVPEDELLKGNCSLVLKNVTVTDAGIYSSSMLVKDTQKSVLVQKIKLSVDDGISDERGSSPEDSDSHQTGGNIWIIWLCVGIGIVLIIGVSVCYIRLQENLQKLHKSLTVIMSLLYIYILWVTACVDCNVSPTDAAESLVTVSAPVGSTVILPCNLTEVFTNTSLIRWQINRSDVVFERSSNGVSSGSGYEGRVDIPEDELLKGNCSLVLKNVSFTDDHLYKTFTVEHVDSTNPTEVKEINRVNLSVYALQISARVGSTAVLPCEWSHLSIQTPHVQWVINSEIVFERKGKELFQSKRYEGRVDVPEDELLKGNCSLVLKNVTVTDAGNYSSSMRVKDTQESVLVQKIKLSVDDGISDETRTSHQTGGNIWIICLCVVGIVLIIGVSVYCYVKRQKIKERVTSVSCCSRTTNSTEQV